MLSKSFCSFTFKLSKLVCSDSEISSFIIIMILSCGEISSDVYSESILSHEDFVIFEELLPISGKL